MMKQNSLDDIMSRHSVEVKKWKRQSRKQINKILNLMQQVDS